MNLICLHFLTAVDAKAMSQWQRSASWRSKLIWWLSKLRLQLWLQVNEAAVITDQLTGFNLEHLIKAYHYCYYHYRQRNCCVGLDLTFQLTSNKRPKSNNKRTTATFKICHRVSTEISGGRPERPPSGPSKAEEQDDYRLSRRRKPGE